MIKPSKDVTDNIKCCPIDHTFSLIGKRFTVHILRDMMMFDKTRFNQLLDSVEDANPKTLSIRLKEMEQTGLISRSVYDETPIRVEYQLTEKGKQLRPILEQMAAFSLRFCSDVVFKDKKPRTLRQAMGMTPSILK